MYRLELLCQENLEKTHIFPWLSVNCHNLIYVAVNEAVLLFIPDIEEEEKF